jgi:phage internal scaffolding protein
MTSKLAAVAPVPDPMIGPIKWRYAYDGLEDAASAAAAIDFGDEPSLTDQSGADDADINVILKRFGITGKLPESRSMPEWGVDFTGVMDYQSAQNHLIEAQSLFMEIPADLRKRFDNDPGQFMDFVADPKNKDALKEFGLLAPEPAVVAPMEVRVVPDPVVPPVVPLGGS